MTTAATTPAADRSPIVTGTVFDVQAFEYGDRGHEKTGVRVIAYDDAADTLEFALFGRDAEAALTQKPGAQVRAIGSWTEREYLNSKGETVREPKFLAKRVAWS